jgi:hypothetical protein
MIVARNRRRNPPGTRHDHETRPVTRMIMGQSGRYLPE